MNALRSPREQATIRENPNLPILEGIGLSKSFGHVEALGGVDIALNRGEIVALVGDNGAGKSTLVSLLSGLSQPDDGSIRVNGETISLDSPSRAQALGIATVFQNLALVNQRNVAANLFLGAEPRRAWVVVDRRRMVREAQQVIARLRVGLPSVQALAGDLSGGQRQAVAVARAVMRGGNILLMDEPTAALGVRESTKVLDLISLLPSEGRSVLLVSHNLETVMAIATRVVVMRLGRKIAELKTSETSRAELVGLIVGGHTL